MSDEPHIYCLLARVRKYPGRTAVMEYRHAWVPVRHAVLYSTVQLRCPEGMWICGWEIREMYQSSHPERPPDLAAG